MKKDAVLAELSVTEFLEKSGFESEKSGSARRYCVCPVCGPGSTDKASGKFWARDDFGNCNACKFSGDLFAVAGAVLDLDTQKDFPAILSACAAMAGVDDSYDLATAQKKLEARQWRRQQEERKARLLRERAERGAPVVSSQLKEHSRKGKDYLAGRGIMPQFAGRECRYGSHSVCLPLGRDGRIVNVVGRRFDGGSPKVRGLAGCGTDGTFGRPVLNKSHVGPVVITEGFMDYLSAKQLSPNRLVLGAHGALRLPYVAEVAAKLIVGTDHGLVLVPHQDSAGLAAMERARAAAIAAGVSPAVITVFEVAAGCNDLNDHLNSASARRVA